MKTKARRLILIGLDAATLPFVKRFIKEGIMPHVARLFENGISAEATPSTPVDTPTNWTTIATGANVNVHGVPSFTTHVAGEDWLSGELRRARTKHSRFSMAEFFWNTAEKHGKRCLIINYPVAWPPTLKDGIVIGGMCPGADLWRIDGPAAYVAGVPREVVLDLENTETSIGAKELLIHPSDYPGEVDSELSPMETEIELVPNRKMRLFIISEGGLKYDAVLFKAEVDGVLTTIRLHEGEWSQWITSHFGTRTGIFRFKLLRLSEDGREVEIYRTDIFSLGGWSYPRELAQPIVEHVGPYIEGLECPFISPDKITMPYGPVNVNTSLLLEVAAMQAQWFSSTCRFLLEKYGWDVLFMHYHLVDALGHAFLAYLDPRFPRYSPSTAKVVWAIYEKAFHIIDNMVGQIVENCADGHTVVGVISDHGMLPCWKAVNVIRALAEAELLHYKWDHERHHYAIDISHSKVIPYMDPQHIWVNLKDRDPGGIVDYSEYESIRTATIEALRSIKDPDNGNPVMALVARKEELGLTGPAENRIGDVVFFLKPSYSTWDGTIGSLRFSSLSENPLEIPPLRPSGVVLGHHTPCLPYEKHGIFSNRAMFILSGPGVRRQLSFPSPINLKDVAVTLALLMGFPPPKHADGQVIEGVLEGS